jgi:hypothetical protein
MTRALVAAQLWRGFWRLGRQQAHAAWRDAVGRTGWEGRRAAQQRLERASSGIWSG